MTTIRLNISCGEALNEANHFTDKDMEDVYFPVVKYILSENDSNKAKIVKVLFEKRKDILQFLSGFEIFTKSTKKYIIEGPKLAKGLKKNKWDLGEAYVAIKAWRENLNTVIEIDSDSYDGNEGVYLRTQNILKEAYDNLKILTIAFVEIDAITQMIKQL